jgi:DNA repair exonuclease SbcCD ATPase subunit
MYKNKEIDLIKTNFEKLKRIYYNEKGKCEQLEKQRDKLSKKLLDTKDKIEILNSVKVLLQNVSEYTREQSKKRIEEIVSNSLQYIFDENVEFKIEIEEVRGKADAEFYVITKVKGEEIKTKPQDARGGGVIDIISLAMRIAMIQCGNLDISGTIILDEPAKHVSEEYITNVAEFLRQTTKILNRQIIMVTHNRHLSEISDKCYRIEMDEGVSRVVIES